MTILEVQKLIRSRFSMAEAVEIEKTKESQLILTRLSRIRMTLTLILIMGMSLR